MNDSIPNQLDSLETNGVSRPPESYRSYCESKCETELIATRKVYERFDPSKSKYRLKAFDECRTGAWFARNELTGKVRILSQSCHLRWCPMCSATRQWFLSQQITSWLASAGKPKFLTLTLAHTSAPLAAQINHLYNCFKKFRKLNILKRNISGGVWFFQIKKSDNDNLWHPHLHCVIDSEYMDKFALSAAWAAITVTSKILDIKTVFDADTMAEYVARYAARPSLLSKLSAPDQLEVVESLHGRRLVGTWGNARVVSLRPSKPPDADQWKNIGSYAIVSHLVGTDPRAAEIWQAYKNNLEISEDCNLRDLEDLANNVQKIDCHTVEEGPDQLKLFDTKWYEWEKS